MLRSAHRQRYIGWGTDLAFEFPARNERQELAMSDTNDKIRRATDERFRTCEYRLRTCNFGRGASGAKLKVAQFKRLAEVPVRLCVL
jgi:hypothetical protein